MSNIYFITIIYVYILSNGNCANFYIKLNQISILPH